MKTILPFSRPFACFVDNTRVVDLCCGMGGLSVAAREMGMRVVAGVDVNPSAVRTFSKNFPEAEAIEGSVESRTVVEQCRKLLDGEEDGEGVRIVVSGPPCQGFSAAGSRDPKGRRNGVLVAVARAIANIQPDCALIENVSTVLAEKHGERLEEDALGELPTKYTKVRERRPFSRCFACLVGYSLNRFAVRHSTRYHRQPNTALRGAPETETRVLLCHPASAGPSTD
jgi:16S rRNA G966 N2-methylase RsmD